MLELWKYTYYDLTSNTGPNITFAFKNFCGLSPWEHLRAPVYTPVYRSVYRAVYRPLYSEVHSPVYSPVCSPVYSPLYSPVYIPVYRQL